MFSNAGAFGNAEYPFIAMIPWSNLTQSSSTWYGPIYGSNRTVWHLNCVLRNFENPNVTDERTTKNISNQLDIKLGEFTQEELDVVLWKIKNSKAASFDENPQKYGRHGLSRTYCSDTATLYLTKNRQMKKGLHPPFSQEEWPRITEV